VSQENVEIVRQLNTLFNAGEAHAARDLIHPDVQHRDLQHAPDLPETVRGRDSMRRVLAQWASAYDDLTADVVEYVDADPWVLVEVRWHGKGKGSGLQVDNRTVDACKVHDGKIVEYVVGYRDMATALADLGLEE
jgi:ketosteroid isomerase-like protein